jgi:MinD-like ATPase involved in chromosome partitioning or flagellar assembly
MEFILIITKNQELASRIHNIDIKNFNILVQTNLNHIISIIQEYMPKYIIITQDIPQLYNIKKYITENTQCELIVAGKSKAKDGNIYIKELNSWAQLSNILDIIKRLESEKENYRVINQQVTSLFSVQGGVGKTSLALNIAYYMANLGKIKVLLIDFNLGEGQTDLAFRLNLPEIPNMGIFIKNTEKSPQSLWESIYQLKELNIDILQPPLTLEQSDQITVDMIDEMVYSARKKYDYIVVDLPYSYQNNVLEMINISTKLLLVLTPNMGAVGRANKLLKYLPQQQYQKAVINRAPADESQKKNLKRELNIDLRGWIPIINQDQTIQGFPDMQQQLYSMEEMII